MTLAPGTRLGPYEIGAPLGAGGMGEVYRAKDTRLDCSVAIKVLPPHLSSAPEIRARFEREARAVSSLNHPHICTLHDVGHQDGIDYLVMELVEGESLAARLERGPLPTEQLLKIGIEIADALDRAHRSGIVHRDLKPGNIMLTKSGAKLMDFGLARAAGLGPAPSDLTQSPTVSRPLTAEGTIVGTFQYMAPEQLEGKEADARSDIFAFGTVLYEMATGRKAFQGRSQASLIAAILEHEPTPISTIAPMAPPALERVVRRCLAKDPEERWQNARDLVHELTWIRDAGSQAGVPAPVAARRRSRERLAWSAAIVALLAAIAVVVVLPRRVSDPTGGRAVQFFVPMAKRNTLGSPSQTRISPDGATLAFTASDSSGTNRLWIRPLDALESKVIPGTDNASFPIWSPDNRQMAFFADGKLKKVSIGGGSVQELCEAKDGRGGTWNRKGVILFAPFAEGPLYRVSSNGGQPVRVTALDTTRHETGHRWPCFLPDGRHFLYVSMPPHGGQCETFVGSLDGKERKPILTSTQGPTFAPPGYLIFTRGRTLMAQEFDDHGLRLKGDPLPLAELELLGGNLGEPFATASATGVLTYDTALSQDVRFEWFDSEGRTGGFLEIPPGPFLTGAISLDGRQIAMAKRNTTADWDLSIVELGRSTVTRFTSEPGIERSPVWSPDGDYLLYASNRAGPYDFYRKPVNSSGPEEVVLKSNVLIKSPTDWSRDGRYIVFQQSEPGTGYDIWLLPLFGDRKAFPWLRTVFNEGAGALSPDGRWMAYISDESGRFEVYVQPFPGPGRRVQVSIGGGDGMTWTSDGREIIYSASNGNPMVVSVTESPSFDVGQPRLMFKLPQDNAGWTVSADGRRFLMTVRAGEDSPAVPTVVLNWRRLLKR